MFSESIVNILVNHDFCSSRAARNFLKKNQVFVNKERILDYKFPVKIESDEIIVNGKILEKGEHLYIVMNKPLGYVCSYTSDSHPLVYDLLSSVKVPAGLGKLHTVGRLDLDTSGLLLLTTNGTFSHKLASPESHVKKKYRVFLEKALSKDEELFYQKAFEEGIFLPAEKKAGECRALPAEIEFLDEQNCVVTVCQGKFHQVRRMFSALGNKVVKLERIQFGSLIMAEELKTGTYRFIGASDVEKIL